MGNILKIPYMKVLWVSYYCIWRFPQELGIFSFKWLSSEVEKWGAGPYIQIMCWLFFNQPEFGFNFENTD
jgi:hypothetical protein